jgi:hypothetical protein
MLDKTTELMNKTFASGPVTNESFARGHELKQLGITYRGSPIIIEIQKNPEELVDPYRSGEDGKLWPGDRAPDATIGLHDLFKVTRHTVLVFAQGMDSQKYIQEAQAFVKQWPAPAEIAVIYPKGHTKPSVEAELILEDTDGSAFANYKVEEGRSQIAIVRPDGVLGARSERIEALEEYAQKVFN